MSTKEATANASRKGSPRNRLTRAESETCYWSAYAFFTPADWHQPTRAQRQRVSIHYRRTIEDAGLEYQAPKNWPEARNTLRLAILKLANENETSSSAHKLQKVAADFQACMCAKWDAERAQRFGTAQADTPAATRKVTLADDDHEWRHVGVPAGSVASLTPAPKPFPRQPLIMYRHAGEAEDGGRWDAGRFVRFEPFEGDMPKENGPGITLEIEVESGEQSEVTFLLAAWTAYTITDVRRHNPHADKIAELRQRLDKIDADDITDSTARFNVEREIDKLENEQSPADEWAGFDLVNA
jgi:hypothetical protein